MPVRKQVEGDLLNADEKFIGQQCNCVTVKTQGLAAAITKRFAYGDPYGSRAAQSTNTARAEARDTPGTIRLLKPVQNTLTPDKDKIIVCLFAQWAPGKPGAWAHAYPPPPPSGEEDSADTAVGRLAWFKMCLDCIDESPEIDGPVALPHGIGCGLAGGDWSKYMRLLEDANTDFVLYHKV